MNRNTATYLFAFAWVSFLASCAFVSPSDKITFYDVDMVCGAAHHIGCGSMAKPLLKAMEETDEIEEAWMDRKGIVVGLVWKEGTAASRQEELTRSLFEKYRIAAERVNAAGRDTLDKKFRVAGSWYRNAEVDELSKEEAGVIADRIIGMLKEGGPVADSVAVPMREEIRQLFADKFAAITGIDEIDDEARAQLETNVGKVITRYMGEDRKEQVRVIVEERGLSDPEAEGCCKDKLKACKTDEHTTE